MTVGERFSKRNDEKVEIWKQLDCELKDGDRTVSGKPGQHFNWSGSADVWSEST